MRSILINGDGQEGEGEGGPKARPEASPNRIVLSSTERRGDHRADRHHDAHGYHDQRREEAIPERDAGEGLWTESPHHDGVYEAQGDMRHLREDNWSRHHKGGYDLSTVCLWIGVHGASMIR